MARFFPLLLALIVGYAQASDGELGWTSLSFCNGAGYCVDIASSTNDGIKSLRIKRNGNEIALPKDVANGVQIPVLNEVRLINVWRADGVSENQLEVPFLTPNPDGRPTRSILRLILIQDKFSSRDIKTGEAKVP